MVVSGGFPASGRHVVYSRSKQRLSRVQRAGGRLELLCPDYFLPLSHAATLSISSAVSLEPKAGMLSPPSLICFVICSLLSRLPTCCRLVSGPIRHCRSVPWQETQFDLTMSIVSAGPWRADDDALEHAVAVRMRAATAAGSQNLKANRARTLIKNHFKLVGLLADRYGDLPILPV